MKKEENWKPRLRIPMAVSCSAADSIKNKKIKNKKHVVSFHWSRNLDSRDHPQNRYSVCVIDSDAESWHFKGRQKVKKYWGIICTFAELQNFWVKNDKRNYLVKINSWGKGHKARLWQSWSRTQANRPRAHIPRLSVQLTGGSDCFHAHPVQLTAQRLLLPPCDFIFLFFLPTLSPDILIYIHLTSFTFLGKTAKGNANREGIIMRGRKTF